MAIKNVERVLLGYLRRTLGVPVYQTVPPDPPDVYVRIHRTGGVRLNLITDNAMVSISVYAEDPGVAGDLANTVREAMTTVAGRWLPDEDTPDRAWCRWWREATGPAYYPDPDHPRRVRYQFAGELRLAIR